MIISDELRLITKWGGTTDDLDEVLCLASCGVNVSSGGGLNGGGGGDAAPPGNLKRNGAIKIERLRFAVRNTALY